MFTLRWRGCRYCWASKHKTPAAARSVSAECTLSTKQQPTGQPCRACSRLTTSPSEQLLQAQVVPGTALSGCGSLCTGACPAASTTSCMHVFAVPTHWCVLHSCCPAPAAALVPGLLCRLCCTPGGAVPCTLPPCSPRRPWRRCWRPSRRQRRCCRAQACRSREPRCSSSSSMRTEPVCWVLAVPALHWLVPAMRLRLRISPVRN